MSAPITLNVHTASGAIMPLNPATTLRGWFAVIRMVPPEGAATLSGTVMNFPATPVARRVVLIEERSGRVVSETWSNPQTGAYTFGELRPQARYTVLAYDHTGNFAAVIADNLSPTP